MTRALLACLLLAAPAAAADRRPITDTDLFRFVWIADPRLSPDGTRVAFVRVTADEKREGYETAIWMVPADGSEPARPFTGGPGDTAPRWSPDGRTLAFLRAEMKDGKREPAQIHLIPAGGGEARAVSEVPRGAGAPVWSPDGRWLAFTATANDRDVEAARRRQAGGKDAAGERESDVRVITGSVYRGDGSGYDDPARPRHVWLLEVPAPGGKAEARPLTRGPFDEDDLAWSHDGARVFFTSHRARDRAYEGPEGDVFSVPREGGEPRREASIDGPIGGYALAADGRRIAFTGYVNPRPVRSYDQQDLFLAGAGEAARNLTSEYDADVGGGILGDQRAPRGGLATPLVWTADQRALIFKSARRGRGNLARLDLGSGTVSAL
ncbi:MAG TPA: S9 family peptidase, partial [Vicinamibacteria bacterium]|nr:S9 family peptidase [Vicinamibacteria bacterium]